MKTYTELFNEAFKNPTSKDTFKELKDGTKFLKEDFFLCQSIIQARKAAGLTQAAVAKRMGTKKSAVARLERSLATRKHSPAIVTLRKYANAVGCCLEIKLIPK